MTRLRYKRHLIDSKIKKRLDNEGTYVWIPRSLHAIVIPRFVSFKHYGRVAWQEKTYWTKTTQEVYIFFFCFFEILKIAREPNCAWFNVACLFLILMHNTGGVSPEVYIDKKRKNLKVSKIKIQISIAIQVWTRKMELLSVSAAFSSSLQLIL